jgi:hypothetical protein
MVTFQISTDFFGISHNLYIDLMSIIPFDIANIENNSYKSSKGFLFAANFSCLQEFTCRLFLLLLQGNNWMWIFPVRVTMRFLFRDSREG